MAARAFTRGTDLADDETTIERRPRSPQAITHGERAPAFAFDLLGIDEPFGELMAVHEDAEEILDDTEPEPEPLTSDAATAYGAVLEPYLAHLTAQRIPDHYLPHFEAEALAFCARFHPRAPEQLDVGALDAYLEEGRFHSLSDRALRNRRVACQAFLDFLRERANSCSARAVAVPPPVPAAPASRGKPGDKRRARRVRFVAEVHVEGLGVLRCSDLSVGGMYLETVAPISRGTLLHACLRLRASDPELVTLTARVAFVHPQFGIGVEFVEIAPRDKKRIASIVAAADVET